MHNTKNIVLCTVSITLIVLLVSNCDTPKTQKNTTLSFAHSPKTKTELVHAIQVELEAQGNNANLNNIDTSAIIDMSGLFENNHDFNGDISKWDVSKVTDMRSMFARAAKFNQDISDWDVSKVTDMSYMFSIATAFNQDISRWRVSQVTNMSYMFIEAISFNQDISRWDVSKVTDIRYMFSEAEEFNQDVSRWGKKLKEGVITTNMFKGSGVTTPPAWYTP